MDLDLFSEDTPRKDTSMLGKPSSPAQETETLKELRLEEQREELLDKRNALKAEVAKLEKQWNEMRTSIEIEESNEEDEAITSLLLQKANQQSENTDSLKQSIPSASEGEDLDKFSAKPSKDWSLRLEYLRRFYPDITISKPHSKLSLEYKDPSRPSKSQLVKTISFIMTYPRRIISIEAKVHLLKDQSSYRIDRIELERKSNNGFNSLLESIIRNYTTSKNINEFLATTNTLYNYIQKRWSVFKDLHHNYTPEEPELPKISNTSYSYRSLLLNWELVFQDQLVKHVVCVNENFNDVFEDLLDQYGVQTAFEKLVEQCYPKEDI